MEGENESKQYMLKVSDIDPEKVLLIDEAIPLEVQMAYIQRSKKLRHLLSTAEAIEKFKGMSPERMLFDKSVNEDNRLKILSFFAALGTIEAYRIVEDFLCVVPPSLLRQWALMAELQLRVDIRTMILNEKQFAISTGLGGRNGCIRYTSLLHTSRLQDFKAFEYELLTKELTDRLAKVGGELEQIEYGSNYVALTYLTPIRIKPDNVLTDVINECREYGGFIAPSILIMNVEPIKPEMIRAKLREYAKENNIDTTH